LTRSDVNVSCDLAGAADPHVILISNSHYWLDCPEQRKVRADRGVSPGGKQSVRSSGPLITLSEMKVQTVRRTVRKGQESVRRAPDGRSGPEEQVRASYSPGPARSFRGLLALRRVARCAVRVPCVQRTRRGSPSQSRFVQMTRSDPDGFRMPRMRSSV